MFRLYFVAYVALLAVGFRLAGCAQALVRSHGAVVREVSLARAASFAGLAASVEGRLQVLPGVREGGEGLVFGAGRAAVRPGLGRAVVAQNAARRVLAQLPELGSLPAEAAGFVLVSLGLLARVADVGVCGEVPQRAFLCALGAP